MTSSNLPKWILLDRWDVGVREIPCERCGRLLRYVYFVESDADELQTWGETCWNTAVGLGVASVAHGRLSSGYRVRKRTDAERAAGIRRRDELKAEFRLVRAEEKLREEQRQAVRWVEAKPSGADDEWRAIELERAMIDQDGFGSLTVGGGMPQRREGPKRGGRVSAAPPLPARAIRHQGERQIPHELASDAICVKAWHIMRARFEAQRLSVWDPQFRPNVERLSRQLKGLPV